MGSKRNESHVVGRRPGPPASGAGLASPEAELRKAYDACEEVVARHALNFKYSFVFLPPDQKRALAALYAFCRACDDVADGDLPVPEKLRRLGEVRGELADCLRGAYAGPPYRALGDAILRFRIPGDLLEYIIQGVEQDLTVRRYEVFGQLRDYCFRVASAVGLACLEIFGYSDASAKAYGIDLGIAMQLVNIIRDVGEDARSGRVYLPQEELRRFAVSEPLAYGPGFIALMRSQAAKAREYFERARPLAKLLPRRSRSCPLALSSVYEKLLGRIERSGFRVLDGRIRLGVASKAASMIGALVRSWV